MVVVERLHNGALGAILPSAIHLASTSRKVELGFWNERWACHNYFVSQSPSMLFDINVNIIFPPNLPSFYISCDYLKQNGFIYSLKTTIELDVCDFYFVAWRL